jgi:hypothetical protein
MVIVFDDIGFENGDFSERYWQIGTSRPEKVLANTHRYLPTTRRKKGQWQMFGKDNLIRVTQELKREGLPTVTIV